MTIKKFAVFLMALALPFALMSCSDDPIRVIDVDDDNGNGNGGNGEVANIEFPITFEEDIPWEDFITNFDGGELSVADNPDKSGINTSDKVAKMVKGDGEPWGGSVILLPESIDFVDGTGFTVSVWAPRENTRMLFKIENEDEAGQAFEQEITVAESQEWVDVTFNLAGANQSFTYEKLVFIFDLGTVGDGSDDFTWYFDNIRQAEGDGNGGSGEAVTLPVTFDDDNVDYGLTDFGGNESEIVTDPTDGTNKVVETIKTVSAELWAGTTVGGEIGFANPIPFTSSATTMSVRVWSPTAGTPIRLKVEDAGDPTISVETETNTTVASEWETLVFDFSNEVTGTATLNLSSNYNKASIFFNFGTTGGDAGEQTYYWDDVEFGGDSGGGGGGGGDIVELPLTFEQDIAWADAITNFEGGDLSVVDNPDQTGNTSAKVAQMVKGTGAVFAGSIITLTDNINFADGTDFNVSVWAPRPNTTMLFKIENESDPGQNFEQELTIAESQQWVDITFDMSGANQANTYKKLVFIFDNGTAGDGSADYTWYFDDITQSAGDGGGGGGEGAPNSPVDFEAGGFGADWTWTVFENDANPALEIIDNPDATGANTSSKVAKFTALQTGNPWAGVESAHGTTDLGPFVLDATNSTIRIMVWKTVISDVGIKLVSANGWSEGELKVANTVVNQWEELVFDFSSYNNPPAAEGQLDQVVVFPDFDMDGRGQDNIIYFDNITFSAE